MCAASLVLDIIKVQTEADIFTAVRYVQLTRPQFIPTMVSIISIITIRNGCDINLLQNWQDLSVCRMHVNM